MYAILKNNICVGVNNLPLDEVSLNEDERQVEQENGQDPIMLLGKTYVDGKFVETEKTAKEKQTEENLTQTSFLIDTDWKVIRHRDQLDLGIEPSLTEAEYKLLLEERQRAREAVITMD